MKEFFVIYGDSEAVEQSFHKYRNLKHKAYLHINMTKQKYNFTNSVNRK